MPEYARNGITQLEQSATDGIVHTPRTSEEFEAQMGRLVKVIK